MRKVLLYIFLGILFVFMVVFFVANRHMVLISFDPISLENPAFAFGPMPMWSAMAASMAIGFLLGAIGMWLSDGTLRQKAKDRKREIRRLKEELKQAQAQNAPPEEPKKGLRLPALRG